MVESGERAGGTAIYFLLESHQRHIGAGSMPMNIRSGTALSIALDSGPVERITPAPSGWHPADQAAMPRK